MPIKKFLIINLILLQLSGPLLLLPMKVVAQEEDAEMEESKEEPQKPEEEKNEPEENKEESKPPEDKKDEGVEQPPEVVEPAENDPPSENEESSPAKAEKVVAPIKAPLIVESIPDPSPSLSPILEDQPSVEPEDVVPSEDFFGTEEEPAEASESASVDESSSESEIETGDAEAITTNVGLINTTQVNSELEVTQTNVEDQEGSVSLLDQESPVLEGEEDQSQNSEAMDSGEPVIQSEIEIDVYNQATVSAETVAEANTGQNSQDSGADRVSLHTGKAIAAANSIFWINSTLINSRVEYDIINILENFEGDLIAYNPYYFEQSTELENDEELVDLNQVEVSNQASVDNQTESQATTGENLQIASSSATTLVSGDATAKSLSQVEVNSTYINILSYLVLINDLSSWRGLIYGWEGPESVKRFDPFQSVLSFQAESEENLVGEIDFGESINVENQADVSITTVANANTGGNSQVAEGDEAKLETGDAVAIANSDVMVNTTVINSDLKKTQVNILSDWGGALVFAYPDLKINVLESPALVEAEQQVSYLFEIVNQGLVTARDVVLTQALSPMLSFISDSLGGSEQKEDGTREWALGDISPNQSVLLAVTTQAQAGVSPETSIVSSASVMSRDLEVMDNNFVTIESLTEISRAVGGNSSESKVSEDNTDQVFTRPDFQIQAKNNVNQFVYAGDSVIFEISLQNLGGESQQTGLYTLLVDEFDQVLGGGAVPLDKVRAGEDISLSFQMALPEEAFSGDYALVVWAEGVDGGGEFYSSGEVLSMFYVQGEPLSQFIPQVEEVQAQWDLGPERVLGASDIYWVKPESSQKSVSIWSELFLRALLMFLISVEYMIRHVKRVWVRE